MSLLLTSTGKVSLIVLMALGATVLLRRRPAAVRHWILAVAVTCATLLPFLSLMLPSWHIGLGAMLSALPAAQSETMVSAATPLGEPVVRFEQVFNNTPAAGAVRAGFTVPAILAAIWIAGLVVSLAILLIGLARLKWLAYGARRIEGGCWFDLATEISRVYALRRTPALLQSDHPTLLVTWGLSRPKIVLPAAAPDWPADRVGVVLRHELAHIRRGDWAAQMAAEVLRAIYWFNPLVWVACSRLRQESEQACDDAVLGGGVDRCEYATHLLNLARTFNADRRTRLAALAMARPSSLEGRVRAMLNTTINHGPITRSARFATVIAILSVTLPIAGFGAQSTYFSFSGSVLDPTNRLLPNAVLALTNTRSEAKYGRGCTAELKLPGPIVRLNPPK